MKRKNAYSYLSMVLLAFVFILNVIVVIRYAQTHLDSDMASEMILAKMQNQQHKTLISNWFYSTEIRILYLQVFFRFWLLLFPNNWTLVRILSAICNLILYIGVIYYFAKSIGLNRDNAIFVCALALIPFHWQHLHFTLFSQAYMPHIVLNLIAIGSLINYIRTDKKHHYGYLIALLFASLFSGLAGIRFIFSVSLPIVTTLMLLILAYSLSEQGRWVEGFSFKRIIVGSLCVVISSVVGYFILHDVLAKRYHIYTWLDQSLGEFSVSRIIDNIGHLFTLFGYRPNSPVASVAGISNVFGICVIFILLFFFVYGLYRRINYSGNQMFFVYLLHISILVNAIIFSLAGIEEIRYWLPLIPLILAYVLLLLQEIHLDGYRAYISRFLLVVTLLGASIYPLFSFEIHQNRQMVEITDYLQQNGYTNGYATFWSGNVITELSNGKIDVWSVRDCDNLEILDWLQKESHFTDIPTGKVFVIINRTVLGNGEYTDPNLLDMNSFKFNDVAKYLILKTNDYEVYSFDDDASLKEYLRLQ